jgi:hypothetical protein
MSAFAPEDTEGGQHEGSVVDPDGNVIRFGSSALQVTATLAFTVVIFRAVYSALVPRTNAEFQQLQSGRPAGFYEARAKAGLGHRVGEPLDCVAGLFPPAVAALHQPGET